MGGKYYNHTEQLIIISRKEEHVEKASRKEN